MPALGDPTMVQEEVERFCFDAPRPMAGVSSKPPKPCAGKGIRGADVDHSLSPPPTKDRFPFHLLYRVGGRNLVSEETLI